VFFAVLGLLACTPAASAAPLGLTDCASAEDVHQCSGLVQTWDGVPLDATVTLPREGVTNLPLVVLIHGFGNSKHEYLDPASEAYTGNAFSYARDGYAVLTYTARGLWGSCGTPDSRLANAAACARGYIHLADARYEVRDTQHLVGLLVDEGTADPDKIGVAGDSYGGGQAFMLAALKNRTMLPDGRLTPWQSPAGTRLRIAAAAPVIPWTDLIHAIAPNGRTLTYTIQPPKAGFTPVGVFKTSFANGIFAAAQTATGPGQPVGEPFVPGRPMGYLAPTGTDPEADVTRWVTRADQGEPYDDPEAKAIVDTLERHHSAYYIDAKRRPAPLFIGTGFTDDLFPVDEAIRFVNRTRKRHPRARIAMLLGDFGHQRAQNKDADRALLEANVHAWLDHHLRGAPSRPRGVTATTQTCPRDTPSAGPFTARSFGALARGEVRFATRDPQTIGSDPGDPATGRAIDPVAGGDACVTTAPTRAPSAATYELPTPARRGYTLLGAPAVVADLTVTGEPGVPQIASRLWDVAPDGSSQTLVARGLYRPTADGRQVWELHANGWRFAPGHVPKLELLGADPPYARPSNGDFEIDVNRLQLRLPVRQRPGCRTIHRKARPVVPSGQRLAPGYKRPRGCRQRPA
jgi:dienelactone hydrolase